MRRLNMVVTLLTLIMLPIMPGCSQNSEIEAEKVIAKKEQKKLAPKYIDEGDNIFYIPHSTKDGIISSLKLLLKEHPQLEVITILNDPQPTVELQDVAGYIVICKKKD